MEGKVRVAGIVKESIVDGPGIRLTVFTQGCNHHCEGCHNPHTHDCDGGYEIGTSEILELIRENPLLDGVTLSGGEPFDQAEELAALASAVKELGLSVMSYSGYTFEQLKARSDREQGVARLLSSVDVLVDGPFQLARKNLRLKFRGSENQRILDLRASLAVGEAVEIEL